MERTSIKKEFSCLSKTKHFYSHSVRWNNNISVITANHPSKWKNVNSWTEADKICVKYNRLIFRYLEDDFPLSRGNSTWKIHSAIETFHCIKFGFSFPVLAGLEFFNIFLKFLDCFGLHFILSFGPFSTCNRKKTTFMIMYKWNSFCENRLLQSLND